jgi:hypothetical protein
MGNRDNIQTDNKTEIEVNTKKKKNKKINTYNIATWNVRSMYEGKLDIVREEMKRLDIDTLGISEMKWTGEGHFGGEKDKVMYSGHETHKKKRCGNDNNEASGKVTYRIQSGK